MKFEYNLSFQEIYIRYVLMVVIAIVAGFAAAYISQFFFVFLAAVPVLFLTAITGWCPIYEILKINNADKSRK